MTVIVAHDTPPAVRGLLKRWFIEPRANVFVGAVNRKTREKTIAFLRRHAPGWSALIIHSDSSNSQGFLIDHFGDPARREVLLSGLRLIRRRLGAPRKSPLLT